MRQVDSPVAHPILSILFILSSCRRPTNCSRRKQQRKELPTQGLSDRQRRDPGQQWLG
jgi:hypothetical protein